MGRIREMQIEHATWLEHNFPDQQPVHPLLGIVEEVGELSHAFLKAQQGIRSGLQPRQVYTMEKDALGDIFIYMISYCNSNTFDLETVIEDTWQKVRMRDWRLHPETGHANPRDLEEAHAEGLHDEIPREGCPLCYRR